MPTAKTADGTTVSFFYEKDREWITRSVFGKDLKECPHCQMAVPVDLRVCGACGKYCYTSAEVMK